MAVTGCTEHSEYKVYTGSTETPHPIFSDDNGEPSIQCSMVRLGGNGLYS